MQDSGQIVLFSFGFKYGVPVDVNFLWDVRFLPNPYWQEQLRPLTGCQREVAEYVTKSDAGAAFLALFEPLLMLVAASRQVDEKKMLRFAIGCTGGRHRSVAVVEHLAGVLVSRDFAVRVFHRDIDKDGNGVAGK
jgi:UPF0042 nucleotide-binding protein